MNLSGDMIFVIERVHGKVLTNKSVYFDYGPDVYAGTSWSDIPKSDGRRLFISWMSNCFYAEAVPSFPSRSCMGLPKKMTLHKIDDQYQLRANTLHEIHNISTELVANIPPRISTEHQVLVEGLDSGLYRVQIDIVKNLKSTFGLKFYNDIGEMMVLGFDGQTNNYFIDRSKSGQVDFHEYFPKMIFAPLQYDQHLIKWEVLIDKGSMEVIADGGQTNLSSIYFASRALTSISLVVAGEEVEILEGKVTVLKSIWN